MTNEQIAQLLSAIGFSLYTLLAIYLHFFRKTDGRKLSLLFVAFIVIVGCTSVSSQLARVPFELVTQAQSRQVNAAIVWVFTIFVAIGTLRRDPPSRV